LVFLRLVASPTLAAYDIRREVKRGMVTLRGVVPTAESADRALRIAAWTPGVRGVCAAVTVDPTIATPQDLPRPADAVVAEEVARTLVREFFPGTRLHSSVLWGWQINGGWWGFDVDVDGGDVVLSGSVPTVPHVRRVVESARAVPGVRSVRSLLYVRGTSPGDAVAFSPYGPYFDCDDDPRPDEPRRHGYGYFGPYPPPPGITLPAYPSATCLAQPGAADRSTELRKAEKEHGRPAGFGGGARRAP